MKLLRSFLLFIATLGLFLVAFNEAATGLWGLPANPVHVALTRWLNVPADILARPDLVRILWASAALLVLLIWVMTIGLWRRPPRPFRINTASGEQLLIHPGAMINFVRLQVENHPAIVSHKVSVRQRSNQSLSIALTVYVKPIDSLPSIKRQLEAAIRDGFARVLGIEKIEELTIVIGLDEKTLAERPGPAGMPGPKPEPPARAILDGAVPADGPAEPAAAPADLADGSHETSGRPHAGETAKA